MIKTKEGPLWRENNGGCDVSLFVLIYDKNLKKSSSPEPLG